MYVNLKEVKQLCYLDTLKDSLTNVEIILNSLHQLDDQEGIIPEHILRKDRIRTILHLELGLASYCVLIRKMHENNLIDYDEEIHNDINSIIHSNRFEYFEHRIVVYSQRGKENVNLPKLIKYGHQIIDENEKAEIPFQGKRFKKKGRS